METSKNQLAHLWQKLKTDRFAPWWVLGVLALVVLAYLFWVNGRQWRRFGWIEVGEKQYHVVYALNAQDRQQGLSDRETIGADGMVFVFTRLQQSQFWMYHMRFPLDFVWIADGKVVDTHINIAEPAAAGMVIRVEPHEPADMVIEFPSGTIDRENIVIGTPVKRVPNWYFSLW
jgi:uncharacterized membrane protein (UPF0127 family)